VLLLTKWLYVYDFRLFLGLLRELPHVDGGNAHRVLIILSD
jgi:hypothetical protein